MANKKYNQSSKKNIPTKKGPVITPTKEMKLPSPPKSLNYITAAFIALLGILLYANTFHHSFVLDDFSVIADNKITTGGIDSIPRIFKTGYRQGNLTADDNLYRPLTKAMFALEYDWSGGKKYFEKADSSPVLLHVMNVFLYGLLCGFIFLSLLKFFPGKYYLALITTLLFTFHPIHTEVVANIKSRDEIMTLFFIIASLRFAKMYVDKNQLKWIIPSGLFYFLALLTKESAITYVALLPVSLYFISKSSGGASAGSAIMNFIKSPASRRTLVLTGLALLIAIGYLMIHRNIIGTIGLDQKIIPVADNSLNVKGSTHFQRILTAIYILGLYLKLMIFPHPLSSDYSYSTIELVKDMGHPGFILAFIVHAGLLVYAIWGLPKKLVSSYAILFYFITISIVSNVFTLIGTNMAERLVFMPSLGFCLLAGYGITQLFKAGKLIPTNLTEIFSRKAAIWLVLIPLLVIASLKTFTRNKDWKNVSTLFNADLKTVPNSVHMLFYHAGMITNVDSLAIKTPEQRLATLKFAEKELVKTLGILEEFPNAHGLLGRMYKEIGQYYVENGQGQLALEYYNKGIAEYRRTLQFNDKDPSTFNNFATCFFSIGKYDSAEVYFKRAISITPICYADGLANLGSVYGTFGNISRNNANVEFQKGNVQGGQQKMAESSKYFTMAIDMFNKTLECDKENIQAYQFLAMTYINLGDTVNAKPYSIKYNELLEKKQNRLNKLKQ